MAYNFGLFVFIAFCLAAVTPEGISLGKLETWTFNGLRSEGITILNSKQMKIEELNFVDEGPAVWFMVGTDLEYDKEYVALAGIIIPDEDGSCTRLKGYDERTITLTLPGTMEWSDFNYLSVFCVRFNHNFGFITIPRKEIKAAFGNGTVLQDSKLDLPPYCPQDVEDREPAEEAEADDD